LFVRFFFVCGRSTVWETVRQKSKRLPDIFKYKKYRQPVLIL
jgi:hypothetical protein